MSICMVIHGYYKNDGAVPRDCPICVAQAMNQGPIISSRVELPCASCARVDDLEGLRVKIKHDSWPITLHNDPFILYQEGKISKGKLCEYIALAVQRFIKEGK